jgi:hypothetical protein
MLLQLKQSVLIVMLISLKGQFTNLGFIQVAHILVHTCHIIIMCIPRNTLQFVIKIDEDRIQASS